jgi:hypothetical protein
MRPRAKAFTTLDTEEGRRQSRRVELIFSDSDGRFLLATDQVPQV